MGASNDPYKVIGSGMATTRTLAICHVPLTPDAQLAAEQARDEVARARAARLIARLTTDETIRRELLEMCDLAPYTRGKRPHGKRTRA